MSYNLQRYIPRQLEEELVQALDSFPVRFFRCPQVMRRFCSMLAHYHGQLLNLSKRGQSLGFTHPTIKRYLDCLYNTAGAGVTTNAINSKLRTFFK